MLKLLLAEEYVKQENQEEATKVYEELLEQYSGARVLAQDDGAALAVSYLRTCQGLGCRNPRHIHPRCSTRGTGDAYESFRGSVTGRVCATGRQGASGTLEGTRTNILCNPECAQDTAY